MNCYTKKITPEQAQKIKAVFEAENAVFDAAVQYSVWRAKTSSLQAVYYTSGKFLVQGKDVSDAAAEIDALLGDIQTEKENENETVSLIDTKGEDYIGTDESGKGDFFGPLVTAGVLINNTNKQKFIDLGVKDSKKLNDSSILKMAGIIKANAVHSVVVLMPQKYNELYAKFKNLNKLLAWGHARAIENILEKSPCRYALADKFGDESLIKNALLEKGRNIVLEQCVRAEADIAPAAASVLARAEFVKRMQDLSKLYEMPFSKGASPAVKDEAREFIKRYTRARLKEIAKMHFKTAAEL